jgi:hypothetical protein
MTTVRVPDRFRVPKVVWIWLEGLGLTPMAVLCQSRLPHALYNGDRTSVATAQFFALHAREPTPPLLVDATLAYRAFRAWEGTTPGRWRSREDQTRAGA